MTLDVSGLWKGFHQSISPYRREPASDITGATRRASRIARSVPPRVT